MHLSNILKGHTTEKSVSDTSSLSTTDTIKDGTHTTNKLLPPPINESYLLNTPDSDLTAEEQRLKRHVQLLNTPDSQLGPAQIRLKKHAVILTTDDAELDKEELKIKARMILLTTPDENLTPEQKKAKKRILAGKDFNE